MNSNVSGLPVWGFSTISPPQALIVSLSGEFPFVKPSSSQYPKDLKASFKVVFASVGNAVDKGALWIAPPI